MLPNSGAVSLATLHRELGVPADYAVSRKLRPYDEAIPGALIPIAAESPRLIQLIRPAAHAWKQLVAAAAADDVTLLPLSGFRTVAYQAELIRKKLRKGTTIEEILRVNAAPGYSEHHTGRAVDMGTPGCTPLETAFAETRAFSWLQQRAEMFGFSLSFPTNNVHGFVYEPWHWRWERSSPGQR